MSVKFLRRLDLPMIEGRKTTQSARGYRPHTHPTVSIGVVDNGESRVQIGSRRFLVAAGDVIVIPADTVHACNPVPRTCWSYRMFYLDHAWLSAHCRPASVWLETGGLIQDARAATCLTRVEQILTEATASRTDVTLLRETLARLFAFGRPWTCLPSQQGAYEQFQSVRTMIDGNPGNSQTLASLASHVGLSRYGLIRLFRKHTGMTPHAYHLDRRINIAREWLKAGRAPAEVAAELGFSDQSHLHRVFKARVAATPGEFQSLRA